ncbi:MAG: transglutaminase-like cysteine peptidase [Bdellovibrionales bacterium]|nr:transglutaminase-like cysteine peptidase [Bdellovibrionales bacterium]
MSLKILSFYFGLFNFLILQIAYPAFAKNNFIPLRQEIAPPPPGAIDLCDRYQWACDFSGKLNGNNDFKVAQRLNNEINRKYHQVEDSIQYRVKEYWALPTQRGGDCEDFALLKKMTLIRYGFLPENLLITTVLDRQKRSHAVLVLLTQAGDFVLDNRVNKIKAWNQTGYFFLKIQDPQDPTRWRFVLE